MHHTDNKHTSNKRNDSLRGRLLRDADKLQVRANPNLLRRISNQLTTKLPRQGATANRAKTGWMLGGASVAALLLAVVLLPMQHQTIDTEPAVPASAIHIASLLDADFDQQLDQQAALQEADLRAELLKVETDLQRVGSVMGIGAIGFVK